MTFEFNNVYIKNTSTISGPIEAKGPLNKYFDKTHKDFYINSKSLEKSEVNLQKESIDTLIDKENITKEQIDILISGDLQNQITASSYAAKDYEIPFIGVYSACATSTQSIILASTIIESKKAKKRLLYPTRISETPRAVPVFRVLHWFLIKINISRIFFCCQ